MVTFANLVKFTEEILNLKFTFLYSGVLEDSCSKHCLKSAQYGVFSGRDFPVLGLNTKIYSVNLRIQSKYREIRTRKNSVFGHFSRSETLQNIHRETSELGSYFNNSL